MQTPQPVVGSTLNQSITIEATGEDSEFPWVLKDKLGNSFSFDDTEIPAIIELLTSLDASIDHGTTDGPGDGHDCRGSLLQIDRTDTVDSMRCTQCGDWYVTTDDRLELLNEDGESFMPLQ